MVFYKTFPNSIKHLSVIVGVTYKEYPLSKPYGYWTINQDVNGLFGAESSIETTLDGRKVIVKNPEYPAVLEDDFILNALSHSVLARNDFNRLYPSLDPVSKRRLDTLLAQHPQQARLVKSTQDYMDGVQSKHIRQGVRVRMPKPIRR